jgi:hypothetical protein
VSQALYGQQSGKLLLFSRFFRVSAAKRFPDLVGLIAIAQGFID